MSKKKPARPPHFPVMDGAQPAPREDQIAGIVQRVWSDSHVYHQDVEPLLREWLDVEGCVVGDREFAQLLAKARGEFDRLAVVDGSGAPACPVDSLVSHVYWDVEAFERSS